MSRPQPSAEEAPAGCLGWLVGCVVALGAVIAMVSTGFDFPAGLKDVFDDFSIKARDRHGIGEAAVLVFAFIASMIAALAGAAFVVWLAERFGIGQARVNLLADATAAVTTVAYFVALGLAGDSWALLAASPYVGVFVVFLAYSANNRLRR